MPFQEVQRGIYFNCYVVTGFYIFMKATATYQRFPWKNDFYITIVATGEVLIRSSTFLEKTRVIFEHKGLSAIQLPLQLAQVELFQ